MDRNFCGFKTKPGWNNNCLAAALFLFVEGNKKSLWHGQAAFSNVDSSASFAVLINSGWIYVSITDLYGCTYSDSTFIRVVSNEICNVDFWNHLPNVFTPNNDGLNDSFEFAEHEQEVMHLSVYNRWGKMVFDSGYAKKMGWKR